MTGVQRVTIHLRRVLGALLAAHELHEKRHGFALVRLAGYPTGVIYPILRRLEEEGWVEAEWENPEVTRRRPRHLYWLTPAGVMVARDRLGLPEPSAVAKP